MKSIRQAVVKFVNEKPFVSILPQKNCESGGGCHGCGACGSKPDDESYELPLVDVRGHNTGDAVTVEITGPGEIAGGLVMFALPLLLLVVGGAAGNSLWGDTGMVLAGVGGLVAGFVVVWILAKTVLKSTARIVDDVVIAE